AAVERRRADRDRVLLVVGAGRMTEIRGERGPELVNLPKFTRIQPTRSPRMPRMAKTYKFVPGEYPQIDDVDLPWFTVEDGPLVEALGGDVTAPAHVLWVGIIVDAPLPTPPEGHPDGEPLVQ